MTLRRPWNGLHQTRCRGRSLTVRLHDGIYDISTIHAPVGFHPHSLCLCQIEKQIRYHATLATRTHHEEPPLLCGALGEAYPARPVATDLKAVLPRVGGDCLSIFLGCNASSPIGNEPLFFIGATSECHEHSHASEVRQRSYSKRFSG